MEKKVFYVLAAFLIYSMASAQPVSISITSQNMALVEETREIRIDKGINTINLHNFPGLLDPTSIHAVFHSSSVKIIEQNFLYEQASTINILRKSIGRPIRLLHPQLGTIQGTLLSFEGETLVVQTAENELRLIPEYANCQVVIEKSANEFRDLFTEPKLSWILEAESQSDAEAKISYLTEGLSWSAEYTAIVGKKEENITLASMVNLSNESGKSYSKADLTLISGELHQVSRTSPSPSGRVQAFMETSAKMDSPFKESASFEYHTFHLDQKIDLINNQKKQLPLFRSTDTKTTKSYNYNHQRDKDNVSVFFSIKNNKENNLGIPLPSGRIRVYKRDNDRMLILGEDVISNTSRDETLKIEVGKAFDINAKRTILEQHREGKNTEKLKIAIELRNQKSDNIKILVTEPVPRHRNARIISSNFKVHQQNAEKIEFIIPVKANQSETLNLELIYTW